MSTKQLYIIDFHSNGRRICMYLLKDLEIVMKMLLCFDLSMVFPYCHEFGLRGMPTSDTGLCSHQQPRSLESAVEAAHCLTTLAAPVCFADHDQRLHDPRDNPPRHPRDRWDVPCNPRTRLRLPTVHQCRPGGENYLGSN